MLSSGPAAAFCFPIAIRAPTRILTFLFIFFVFFLPTAHRGTAAGLRLADADWMHAPSKHANTKSFSSSAFMMLSRQSLGIQWLLLLERLSFYTVGTKLPGAHVSSVESFDKTGTTCANWGIALKRDGPGRNVGLLATVVDRGPNGALP